jgi:hypothetical protein
MRIIGAGLSGLIAAHIWPRAGLVEVAPGPSPSHQALLRFRSDAVANVTGIGFKRVTVRKGIWWGERFHAPDISLANAYTSKCLEAIVPDRSIWNIEPVERYIAPEDFYEQLVEAVERRITWGINFFASPGDISAEPILSTAPLPNTLAAYHLDCAAEFKRMPITVQRFRVANCEAYQTIYFPSPDHSMYRASITGSLLIVEHASALPYGSWEKELYRAFMFDSHALDPLSTVRQTFGKIMPIDDAIRKAVLFRLTREHNVFSLGRFACWRNTLLDDVVSDAAVIKRLIIANSHYEGFKANH